MHIYGKEYEEKGKEHKKVDLINFEFPQMEFSNDEGRHHESDKTVPEERISNKFLNQDEIDSDEMLETDTEIENHTKESLPISEDEHDTSDGKRNRQATVNSSKEAKKQKPNVEWQISVSERSNKQYNCNYCLERFTKKHILVAHERTHSGEKPFPCNFCDKSFVQRGTRINHEKLHTGKKPYPCQFCEKSFAHSIGKKIHERSHLDEKPYECKTCDKRFKQQCGLKYHERVHTGDKPYACTFCDKRFSASFSLKRHEQVHKSK